MHDRTYAKDVLKNIRRRGGKMGNKFILGNDVKNKVTVRELVEVLSEKDKEVGK